MTAQDEATNVEGDETLAGAGAGAGEEEASVETLMAKLERVTAERDAERERALRMAAEAENTRRRLERDKAEALSYATAGLARDLLAVADNLQRALAAAPPEPDEAIRPFLTGIEMTERELLRVLAQHGIVPVEAIGQPLDPHAHQAMSEVDDDAPAGTVVAELQQGWRLKERLLRPALVAVSRGRSTVDVER